MIKLEKINKSYKDSQGYSSILQNLELTLNKGSNISLIGESGSGKSTLLNILAGIEKVESGQYWFFGEPVHLMSETKRTSLRRNHIGIIFQNYNLIPTLNISDNIKFSRAIKGLKEDETLWLKLLSSLNLISLLHMYPEELSGGQQQKVAIARALYMEPKLLLADEPTGSLDEKNSQIVMNMLFQLSKEFCCSLILVTHSLKYIKLSEHKYKLYGGILNSVNSTL